MQIPREAVTASLLGLVLCSAIILRAQTVSNSSMTKTLTITDQNANLLNRLKDYPNLEVLSIVCIESLQALPDDIGRLVRCASST